MAFKIGDRVVERNHIGTEYDLSPQIIAAILPDGRVLVGEDVAPNDVFFAKQEEELLSFSDATAEQERMCAAKNALEDQFSNVQEQITDTLNQSAELFREAVKLADKHGKDLFQSHYHETAKIARILHRDCGWRSSAIECA